MSELPAEESDFIEAPTPKRVRATIHIESDHEWQEPVTIELVAKNITQLKHQLYLASFRDIYGENAASLREWKILNELPIERSKKKSR